MNKYEVLSVIISYQIFMFEWHDCLQLQIPIAERKPAVMQKEMVGHENFQNSQKISYYE